MWGLHSQGTEAEVVSERRGEVVQSSATHMISTAWALHRARYRQPCLQLVLAASGLTPTVTTLACLNPNSKKRMKNEPQVTQER